MTHTYGDHRYGIVRYSQSDFQRYVPVWAPIVCDAIGRGNWNPPDPAPIGPDWASMTCTRDVRRNQAVPGNQNNGY